MVRMTTRAKRPTTHLSDGVARRSPRKGATRATRADRRAASSSGRNPHRPTEFPGSQDSGEPAGGARGSELEDVHAVRIQPDRDAPDLGAVSEHDRDGRLLADGEHRAWSSPIFVAAPERDDEA